MKSNAIYIHQIVVQNNCIASQVVIPIERITKIAMKEKLYEQLTKISGVYTTEETHLTEKREKWLIIRNKIINTQTKRDIEIIIKNLAVSYFLPSIRTD